MKQAYFSAKQEEQTAGLDDGPTVSTSCQTLMGGPASYL